MAWANPDGHTMHARITHIQRMHIHQTEVVTTMSRSQKELK